MSKRSSKKRSYLGALSASAPIFGVKALIGDLPVSWGPRNLRNYCLNMKVFVLELSFECHGTLGREAQGREAQGLEARELLEKVLKVISGGSSAH